MPVHNNEIAAMFEEVADLLEIEGANPFRVRAYRNAAQTVRGNTESMSNLVDQDKDLTELPNIGADLAEKITKIVKTGKLPLLREVRSRTPSELSELMKIEGLGPKRIKTLHNELDINSIEDLEKAAADHEIRRLEGFGKKTEENLKKKAENFTGNTGRLKFIEAEEIAAPLTDYLKQSKGIKDLVIAGSYRRCKETVGDLDILVTAAKNNDIMDRFTAYEDVVEVVSQGETRATVQLHSGINVDVRVVPENCYGAALHYFTGSKAHNIAVRKRAADKGYKVNEYGVFRGEKSIAGKTEKEVFKLVGMPFIPPELRENRGELDVTKASQLPELIELEDIKGDLHCHTNATDGHHALEDMVKAATNMGYEYLAITDHSKNVTVANGLDEERLEKQIETIDALNEKFADIVILKSIEVDILEDGSLDLPDSLLKKLDFTLCAVHSGFSLSRKKQTDRILKAMDNPCFNILAHPTGRLINKRDAYDLDLEKVMEGALERGCFLEINAQPERMDLADDACKTAKEMGLKVAISTDSHSAENLDYMRFGINQARRGWLEPKDVINSQPLKKLRKLFSRT